MRFVIEKRAVSSWQDEVKVTLPEKTKKTIKKIAYGALLGYFIIAAHEIYNRNKNTDIEEIEAE